MNKLNEWKYYKIEDLFDVFTGTDLILRDIICNGEYFVTSHKKQNNSVAMNTEIIPDRKLFNCNNTISVADRGYFKATVQTKDFYIGTRVKALQLKYRLCNKNILLFLSTIINLEHFRYSYGRNCCDDLGKLQIKLPTTNDHPDWQYMQDYIGSLEKTISFSKIKTLNKRKQFNKIDDWIEYKFTDTKLWSKIIHGQRHIEANRISGDVNYYSASEYNNSLTDKIANPLYVENHAIVYNTFGSAFYVEDEFTASDEIYSFHNDKLNKYNALFITTIMNQNKYKFKFGRKAFKNKFENETIKLPSIIKKDGSFEPDWQYMEDYIKSLPYADLL